MKKCCYCKGLYSSRGYKYCSPDCAKLGKKEKDRITHSKEKYTAYNRARLKTPEHKAWYKEYSQRLDIKAKVKARNKASRKDPMFYVNKNILRRIKRETHICWLADRPHHLNKGCKYLWESNAYQAWCYWVKAKAPDWWMAEYYKAKGKPWNNPRLSAAEKWTTRYELDQDYKAKAKEKERTRLYKFTHPETVVGWENVAGNRRRWNQAAISADGTVTRFVIKRLHKEKNCAYCYNELTKDNRQIDHVTPLSKEGRHSADNLVACCGRCNMSKGAKKLWQWFGTENRSVSL